MSNGKIESGRKITPQVTVIGDSGSLIKNEKGEWFDREEPNKKIEIVPLEDIFYRENNKKSALANK